MNKELQEIILHLQEVLNGEPWYGKAAYLLLKEINEDRQYIQPTSNSHSLVELLYHMITWSEFTRQRIIGEPIEDMQAFDALDWRQIDPDRHDWKSGISALQGSHNEIISLLQTKDDAFLDGKVDYRDYDFRYLLNGLIQHNIYHLGQVAYVNKLLA